MAYLIRKITRSKWQPEGETPSSVSDVSADAITSCLRTTRNTLSVWYSSTGDWNDSEDVVAALLSSLERPTKVDLVLIDEREVSAINGVNLVQISGDTPANAEINDKHRDIANLKFCTISEVAEIIFDKVRSEKANIIKRYSLKDGVALVKKFVDQGKLDPSRLSERWQIMLGLNESSVG